MSRQFLRRRIAVFFLLSMATSAFASPLAPKCSSLFGSGDAGVQALLRLQRSSPHLVGKIKAELDGLVKGSMSFRYKSIHLEVQGLGGIEGQASGKTLVLYIDHIVHRNFYNRRGDGGIPSGESNRHLSLHFGNFTIGLMEALRMTVREDQSISHVRITAGTVVNEALAKRLRRMGFEPSAPTGKKGQEIASSGEFYNWTLRLSRESFR